MSARRALSAATSTPWALERGDPVDRGAFRAFARSPHAWHPRAFSASAASEKAARASVRPGAANAYSYYPRLVDDGLGYEWRFFQVADDAWWPALVRSSDAPPSGSQ